MGCKTAGYAACALLVKGGQECWGEAVEERTVVQLANMNVTRGMSSVLRVVQHWSHLYSVASASAQLPMSK